MPFIPEEMLFQSLTPNANIGETLETTKETEHNVFQRLLSSAQRANILFDSRQDRHLNPNRLTDPWKSLRGTKYEPFISDGAIYADDEEELNVWKSRIDRQLNNAAIARQRPYESMIFDTLTGSADPTFFVPGFSILKAAKPARRMLGSFYSGFKAGAAGMGLQELILLDQKELHTPQAAAMNTLAGAIGVGFLGAGAAGLMGTPEAVMLRSVITHIGNNGEIKAIIRQDGSIGAMSTLPDSLTMRLQEAPHNLSERMGRIASGDIFGFGSPINNGLFSQSGWVKRQTNGLFNHNIILEKNVADDIATGDNMQSIMTDFETNEMLPFNQRVEKHIMDRQGSSNKVERYKKELIDKDTTYEKVTSEVGDNVRTGKRSQDPEQKAIEEFISAKYVELGTEAQEYGIISKNISPEDMAKYGTHDWNAQGIFNDRAGFKKVLTEEIMEHNRFDISQIDNALDDVQNQLNIRVTEAEDIIHRLDQTKVELEHLKAKLEKEGLKTDGKGKPRQTNLTKIKQVDTHLKKLESVKKPISREQVGFEVDEIINKIEGVGDDTLDLNMHIRKALSDPKFAKHRSIFIKNYHKFKPYMKQDGIGSFLSYWKQMKARIEYEKTLRRMGAESHGDLRKKVRDSVLDQKVILDKNQEIIDRLSSKDKLTKAEKEQLSQAREIVKAIGHIDENTIKKALELADTNAAIMLGQYGTTSAADTALKLLRKYQTITLLGGVAISSLPDLAMPIFKHGLGNTLRDGWLPLIKDFQAAKLARDQLKDMSVGIELDKNTIIKSLNDMNYNYGKPKHVIENIADDVLDTFGQLSGLSFYNNFGKRLAGHMSIARTIRALRAGAKISEKERIRLRSLGIDDQMGKKILAEFDRVGEEVNGSYISNHANWSPDAKRAIKSAVLKDVESTIITPSPGDIPFIASGNEWAKTIFQFKSFISAATNKIVLSGLQRQDSEALQGVIGLMTMGMLTYMLKETIAGRKPELTLEKAITEGIGRSGLAGIIGELGFLFVPGLNNSRYARYNTLQAFTGPTFSGAADFVDLMNRVSDGEISETDKKKMKRFLPFANLFYLRLLMDKVKDK